MRKTLLLTAVLLGLGSTGFTGAQAQVAPQEPTGTVVAPGAAASAGSGAGSATTPGMTQGATPKRTMRKAAARKSMRRMMRHPMHSAAAATSDSEIRPGHEPGVGDSYPASNQASNVTPGDTRSRIAPRLPTPAGGQDASIPTFLRDAQTALNSRQSGRAQEALERAETAMLQRSVAPDQAGSPDQAPDVIQVESARKSLAGGDMAAAKQSVAAAMTAGR